MKGYSAIQWKGAGKQFIRIGVIGGFIFSLFTNLGDLQAGRYLFWLRVWLLNGIAFGVFWVGNGLLAEVPDRWYTWTEAPLKRLFLGVLVTLVFTVLAWYFIAYFFTFHIYGWDILRYIKNVRLESARTALIITFAISTFLHGRSFLFEYRDAKIEAERLKKEQAEARYEVLKNQINPHFLFNSLNVLATLVHLDADKAETFTRRLSDVYRYILDSRDKEIVALDTELELLDAFFFLMKTRFGSGIQIENNIPRGLPYAVAPLTLQMLVENALKHNTASKSKPLLLRLNFDKETETIQIQNILQAKSMVEASSGIGLENIKARYAFLTDKALKIEATEAYFKVEIPLLRT